MITQAEDYCKIVAKHFPTDYNGTYTSVLPQRLLSAGSGHKKAIMKRADAFLKRMSAIPMEDFWLKMIEEVETIYGIVNETCLFFVGSVQPQYLHTVAFELCAYKVESVEKVCESVKRSYGDFDNRSLPKMPFWREKIASAKGQLGWGVDKGGSAYAPISAEERAEVDRMMQSLMESFGESGIVQEGQYTNRWSVLKHGGVYEKIMSGLVQVYNNDGAAVWVEGNEVDGRQIVNNTRSIELVHTGKINLALYEKLKKDAVI